MNDNVLVPRHPAPNPQHPEINSSTPNNARDPVNEDNVPLSVEKRTQMMNLKHHKLVKIKTTRKHHITKQRKRDEKKTVNSYI
ncbi:hypothetical protein CVS40_6336 [Lucilia cuprina]|nr:hypothetical protein CVS40_6336 [Lucilia cuprina]